MRELGIGAQTLSFQAVGLFLGLDLSCLGLIDIGVNERFGQETLSGGT